jgi:hypothetical protein
MQPLRNLSYIMQLLSSYIKLIVNISLSLFCLITLSSFTNSKVVEEPLCTYDSPFRHYSEYQFYKDAYDYRIKNNVEVPNFYYDKIYIPRPIIMAPVIVEAVEAPQYPIPYWILVGILKKETTSYYLDNGSIKYVDKRRGTSGERGPFQMRKICFDTIKKSGEQFWKLEKDTKFAESMTIRYLLYLYNGPAKNNWKVAIGMYNVGPNNYSCYQKTANAYYNSVLKYGKD